MILKLGSTLEHFRKLLQTLVLAMFCALAHAGAYEDFFSAVERDDAGAVAGLLQRGFDPNSRDPKAQTPLILALQHKSTNVIRLLLKHPSLQPDVLNAAGESALMIAALKGDLETCQQLLARGAAVSQPGWSPLHYAATGPEPRTIELFLGRGADIDAPSPNGTTALMMASRYGPEPAVDLLLLRGADPKRRNERNLGAADFAQLAGREALARRLQGLAR